MNDSSALDRLGGRGGNAGGGGGKGAAVAIRTEALTKHYDRGLVQALRGVTVALPRGEFVAVVGPSGSGKSTFLNLIGTLDAPSGGRVWLDGDDIARLPAQDVRRRKVGFVFQFHNLIPNLTLQENVEVPLAGSGLRRSERRARAAALLERVGLGDRARHRANRVSGGERQRAAVARALINQPPIVLADEPTGNLDSRTGAQVLGLLTEVHRERGTLLVVVTHNPEIAAAADRVLRFADGRVQEDGT
ncbi:MAG: ABC transporter ATP-binding protein [Planctomycetota bacterium]